jgi:hypothetical protein
MLKNAFKLFTAILLNLSLLSCSHILVRTVTPPSCAIRAQGLICPDKAYSFSDPAISEFQCVSGSDWETLTERYTK